jgi:hypothetical protein
VVERDEHLPFPGQRIALGQPGGFDGQGSDGRRWRIHPLFLMRAGPLANYFVEILLMRAVILSEGIRLA